MTPLKIGVVAVLTVVVQLTVFVDVRVAGVAPELVALLAVLAGFLAGPERGSTAAFVMGLLWDVYLPTPLGLSAIVFAMVAFAVGSVGAGLFHDSRSQLAAVAGMGTFGAVLGYALLGEVVGQRGLVDIEMLRVALISGVINALLAPLVFPIMRWAMRPEAGIGSAAATR
jgi:rod shape-determining protein MreD